MVFCPNDRRLASGGDDGTLMIWDIATGLCSYKLNLECPVISLVWDLHRDSMIICGCLDGKVVHVNVSRVCRFSMSLFIPD